MPEEIHKLSDVCHQRRAVRHVRAFIGGEAEEPRDLCVECFERSASPKNLEALQRLQKAIRDGKCKYCGSAAVGGSSRKNLWCVQCHQDLIEFSKRPENQLPDFDDEDDAEVEQWLHLGAQRQQRKKEFMRQRVSQRRMEAD
jgi:hypothetical protein